jgi:RhtB (resistance to homoserine/threonine) family protein
MTGIVQFETFLLTGILLNLTPGNDTIFILSKSIGQGKKAGIVSSAGIATGNLIHTVLAAFGLSIIVAKSLVIFNIIKFLGVAYLIFLGIKMLTNKSSMSTDSANPSFDINYWKIYRDGIFTNLLNPKVVLFFIAFLPQFIDTSRQNTVLPFITLGSTFVATGTLWCLVLAWFASAIFTKLNTNQNTSAIINKVCGLALVALGIKLAFTDRK